MSRRLGCAPLDGGRAIVMLVVVLLVVFVDHGNAKPTIIASSSSSNNFGEPLVGGGGVATIDSSTRIEELRRAIDYETRLNGQLELLRALHDAQRMQIGTMKTRRAPANDFEPMMMQLDNLRKPRFLFAMEGLLKSPMLAPDLKIPASPSPMSQAYRIKNYIALHYQNDPEHFNKAFSELADMREVSYAVDVVRRLHVAVLQQVTRTSDEQELIYILKRYYAQLSMMKTRFPMELEGEASVEFSWLDRATDSSIPTTHPDIMFEISCVMFNLGALHASIAATQSRLDEASTKVAFNQFQCAAWPFIHIRDTMNAQAFGIIDFERISLTFYANIMLAQAQECILEKSIRDKRSNTVISRIALFIMQLYHSCEKAVKASKQESSANGVFQEVMPTARFKSWTQLCTIKGAINGIIYFYARGMQFDEDKKFGCALACYVAGVRLANEAADAAKKDKRAELRVALDFCADLIKRKEASSRKDNDFIYHERVPSEQDLDEIQPAEMVKAINYETLDASISGEDLFRELLPSSVIEIVSMYEEKKAALRRKVLADCEHKDEELEKFLLTLHMDKLGLDQPGDIQRLPQELLSCYEELAKEPQAVANMLEKFHELTTKTAEVGAQLTHLSNRLGAITAPQLTADAGYRAIATRLAELDQKHQQARANNRELQNVFDVQQEDLGVLKLPLPELSDRICGKYGGVDPGQSPEGKELRRMLDKVDEMRKQRIKLVETLRDSLERDDITSNALAAAYADPTPLLAAQIARHDKHIKLIEQNLNAQAAILDALTAANANFADHRKDIFNLIASKQSKANKLVNAYDTFKGVREKAGEALKFYMKLYRLLNALDGGITHMEEASKSFVQGRK